MPGVRTKSGRPSSVPTIGSPREQVVGEQTAGVGVDVERLAQQGGVHVVGGGGRADRGRELAGRRPPRRRARSRRCCSAPSRPGSPSGVVTTSISGCACASGALEHDHREDARADADVAGARSRRRWSRPCRCRRRPRAGRAGCRAAARRSGRGTRRPRRSAHPRPRPRAAPRAAARAGRRSGPSGGGQLLVPADEAVVVVARRGVDREHAGGVADAEHVAAGEQRGARSRRGW